LESSLESITIPKAVQFIDGSVFVRSNVHSISIESGNATFVIANDLLIDVLHRRIIHNFSTYSCVTIPCDIETLGSSCFADCQSILFIEFESGSQLKRIESRALFILDCEIVIPSTILFIASDSSFNPSQMRLIDPDFCPEFDQWQQIRAQGMIRDFRRIQRVGSGLPDLAFFLVDLSLFEESSMLNENVGVSIRKYHHKDDELLMVVKSFHLSEFIGSRQIENEIENQVNLHHPCIIAPIGFLFQIGSQELMIARLYVEGCLLREVLSVNPMWWTPTMKAKAVAGIVLGLQFAHSFGLFHGNLKPSNILFDVDPDIQIVEFGQLRLKMHSNQNGDFSSETWSPKVDVEAFFLILIEILVGHSANSVERASNDEIDVLGIPVFLSKLIRDEMGCYFRTSHSCLDIFHILKLNHFQITEDVDTEEVLLYVNDIEWKEQSMN
jgi:hypothetical protein